MKESPVKPTGLAKATASAYPHWLLVMLAATAVFLYLEKFNRQTKKDLKSIWV